MNSDRFGFWIGWVLVPALIAMISGLLIAIGLLNRNKPLVSMGVAVIGMMAVIVSQKFFGWPRIP